MAYKHGIYAEIKSGIMTGSSGAGETLPVYFGTVPIHQLADYTDKINEPIILTSFNQAKELCGYNESWSNYTLCEPIYAHFLMDGDPIGPIALINCFNPKVHKSVTATTAAITFINGMAKILDIDFILNTAEINGKVKGTDYTAEYLSDGTGVLITDISTAPMTTVNVSYYKADMTQITKQTIIDSIVNVGKVYEKANKIPTILAAPKWSMAKDVNNALKAAAKKINNHWFAIVVSDIDSKQNGTIKEAIAAQKAEGRTSGIEVPCWPMVTSGDRLLHISTLSIVTMQKTDALNDGIPFETPSNKAINIDGNVIISAAGLPVPVYYDRTEANELNTVGIRTVSFWGGKYRIWGPHTGAYSYGESIDAIYVFDSSIRMMNYVANSFQESYGIEVDKPMQRSRIDTITNDFQQWLDGLVQIGALLYAKIKFLSDTNPTNDMVSGEFVFDVGQTTAPPARSITANVRYTTVGLDTLGGVAE